MEDVLTLVAVRLKSTRLPRKALEELAGKSLIMRLHERVSASTKSEGIVWCTSTSPEDDELETLAAKENLSVYRGDELDVMSRFIEVAWARGATTLVRVTGDNPLTDPGIMDELITSHRQQEAEYSYTEDSPRGTRSEIIELEALERCHEMVQDSSASEYMTLMLRRPDHFRVNRVSLSDSNLHRPELRLTVDTLEDIQLVRSIYDAFEGVPPPLAEIIQWLDEHPEIRDLNSHIQPIELDSSINVRLQGDT